MKTEVIEYTDANSGNRCEIFKVTTSDGHTFYERDYTSQTDSIETYFEDFLEPLFLEAEESFNKLVSLYDVADLLEDSGDEKEAEKMRLALNSIAKFLRKYFN
jgi:hypothetical protein